MYLIDLGIFTQKKSVNTVRIWCNILNSSDPCSNANDIWDRKPPISRCLP